MSLKVYKALTSFALKDDTVRQGQKRVYDDDELESDLIASGYIEEYDPATADYGATDLSYMFYQGNRTGIIEDVFAGLGDDPVASLDSMCAYCYYLASIDVSALDTSEVNNFNRVFMHCEALAELDLSSWNTSALATSEYIFAYTTALTKIVINNPRMFRLTDANALEGSAIAAGTGFVYVPANMVATYKADAVWGRYASQIKSVSELPD